jgi:geranylgeranyl reductase family protein
VEYDAIVVGAGPAGGSAAYWLGEAGKRVLVLERKRLPRYKTCGGGVPKAVFERFPFDFTPVVEREIGRIRFRFRDGREVLAAMSGYPVAMVMRDRFDAFLLDHARAEVRDGAAVVAVRQDADGVEVETRARESFRARYVIGADGAGSRVAREAGLRHEGLIGAALEAEVPVGPDVLQAYADTVLFLFGAFPQGYLWVFPKAEHLSVGIGALQAGSPEMRATLEREMGKLGIDVTGAPQRGHPLPIYTRHRPLHRGRVMLAGDAAGLIDALLGEGIRHAVDSGRMAAEAVLADDVRSYTRRVQRTIGNNLLWGLRWARLFYEHPRGSFDLGVRNPIFLDEFLRIFAGRRSYRGMALRIPLILLGLLRRRPIRSPESYDRSGAVS